MKNKIKGKRGQKKGEKNCLKALVKLVSSKIATTKRKNKSPPASHEFTI